MSERRTSGFVAGRILGAPVIVQPSTLIMLVVLAYIFASSAGQTTTRTLSIGLLLAASLIASVLLHEVAHAIAARAFGRKVNEIVLTLWGGHTSFDATGLTPVVNGVTAVAGPAMNLVIAGVANVVVQVANVGGLAGSVIAYVAWANVLLAIFNVLPGIPMDGGRVLESIVWGATGNRNKGTLVAAWVGRFVAVAVVVYSLGTPVLQGRAPGLIDVVVALMVFSILWPAASSAIAFSKAMLRRDGLTVASLMVPAVGVPYSRLGRGFADHGEGRRRARDRRPRCRRRAGREIPSGPDRPGARGSAGQPPRCSRSPRRYPVARPLSSRPRPDVLIPELREWWGKTDVLVVVDGTSVVGILRLVDVVAALS